MNYTIRQCSRGWEVAGSYDYEEAREALYQALKHLALWRVFDAKCDLEEPEGDYVVKPGASGYYLTGKRCKADAAQMMLFWCLSNLKREERFNADQWKERLAGQTKRPSD